MNASSSACAWAAKDEARDDNADQDPDDAIAENATLIWMPA